MRSTLVLVASFAFLAFAGCVTEDVSGPGGAGTSGPSEAGDETPVDAQGGSGGGGGNVVNIAPLIQSFVGTPASGTNDGTYTITFSGAAFDANAEKTIERLAIAASGAATVASAHTVTNQEADATTEPAFGADGWKVWSGVQKNDGVLQFQYRYTVPRFAPSGTYNWTVTATDKAGGTGSSVVVPNTVTRFALVEIAPFPVLADGTNAASATWGGWSAQPGASNVEATNFIKLTNAGDKPDQRAVLDFSSVSFAGTTDSGFTIPIDGNVQFAFFEDRTPGVTAPNEGTYTYLGSAAQGSVTVPFTAKGAIVYVKYRLVSLPSVLLDQPYAASFTATEV